MGQLSEEGQRVRDALRGLSPDERALVVSRGLINLATQINAIAGAVAPQSRANAQVALTQGVAEQLITQGGGIFLGEKQLKDLGILAPNATIPPVPEKFSAAFLNADHPLRDGKIAAHIILGFDPDTSAWYCFEKSIVPGSLGADKQGLSGREQDKLLLDRDGQPKTVEEMQYSSPTDYRPIKHVLDNAIKLLINEGTSVENLPFYKIYGRTADTKHAVLGCRVLLSYSDRVGSEAYAIFSHDSAMYNVGLLAGWN